MTSDDEYEIYQAGIKKNKMQVEEIEDVYCFDCLVLNVNFNTMVHRDLDDLILCEKCQGENNAG